MGVCCPGGSLHIWACPFDAHNGLDLLDAPAAALTGVPPRRRTRHAGPAAAGTPPLRHAGHATLLRPQRRRCCQAGAASCPAGPAGPGAGCPGASRCHGWSQRGASRRAQSRTCTHTHTTHTRARRDKKGRHLTSWGRRQSAGAWVAAVLRAPAQHAQLLRPRGSSCMHF